MINSEVTEWWDENLHHHTWSPSEAELEDDARQITVHVWDDEGNDLYFTAFSPIGWDQDELQQDIDDAVSHYIGGD